MSPLSQRQLHWLHDETAPLSSDLLSSFSDLDPNERKAFFQTWDGLSAQRRLQLLEEMGRLSDERIELNFDPVYLAALTDLDPAVRSAAIRNLWESEDPSLAERLVAILGSDPSPVARRAAAKALSQFVLLGELAQLQEDLLHRMEDCLLSAAAHDADDAVHRLCIESLGYSSLPEASALIHQAYRKKEESWQCSALVAMGRSGSQAWAEQVTTMLHNPSPLLRQEAVRACGELELRILAQSLVELLDDTVPGVRQAAIWSLGQVGGRQAAVALRRLLAHNDDPAEAGLIEEALENLAFVDGSAQMLLYGVEEGDEAEDGSEGEAEDGSEDEADDDSEDEADDESEGEADDESETA